MKQDVGEGEVLDSCLGGAQKTCTPLGLRNKDNRDCGALM